MMRSESMTMTPAEYRTMREACGLSQQSAAPFHGVTYRAIQQWEAGVNRVPARTAEEIRALDVRISDGASALIAAQGRRSRTAPPVRLFRWRTQDAYEATHGAKATSLPFGAYNAMLGRAMSRMLIEGRPYVVEWAPEASAVATAAATPPE